MAAKTVRKQKLLASRLGQGPTDRRIGQRFSNFSWSDPVFPGPGPSGPSSIQIRIQLSIYYCSGTLFQDRPFWIMGLLG